MGWFPRIDPFFTDLSGLTLQSGVGVGPGGRLVKDEYSVGGGGSTAGSGTSVGSGMDVDGEMNQTIQHHPSSQQPPPNNPQQPQQSFMPGMVPVPPNPGKIWIVIYFVKYFYYWFFLVVCLLRIILILLGYYFLFFLRKTWCKVVDYIVTETKI